MPRDVRFTVRMHRDEHDMLEVLQRRHDRDRGAMIRWLIKLAYNSVDVVNHASSVRQSCVNDASIVRQLSTENLGGTEVATGAQVQIPDLKEKKKKRKEPELASLDLVLRILGDLNKRTGSNFQARGKVARKVIAARMRDGYEEADFIAVNRKMVALWKGNPKMEHCLNYETLYGPKFEKYLGQPEVGSSPTWGGGGKPQPHERRPSEGDK